jgi:surface antigen
MTCEMTLGTSIANRFKFAILLLLASLLAGCNTTSGSTRLDDTGEQLADDADSDSTGDKPENAAFYIQALKGGLVTRISGLKISRNDQVRALEAEYKALEMSPGGQKVVWDGNGGTHGEVMAAAPYQVGSQNCRQYSHSISVNGGAPLTARGAACRNANGSWTPLI